ncbi:hypothetical protein [Terrarubrum flagellatum]|uniref:hypothetical protein n=1 Tax=Terrirubrum flagellatum TaxID=2895980 RepID=UPI003144F2CA
MTATKGEDESQLPMRPLISRVRCDMAAWEVRFALFRLMLAAKAYNPDQPRVPAGNPDGGQWTDGGFHLLKPRHDPGRREAVEEQFAQQGSSRFDPVVRLGNSWLGATSAQQSRLAASQAQAFGAVARARQADPSWRPEPAIFSEGVEGEIARNEALRSEAEAHLIGIGRPVPDLMRSPDILRPGGRSVGEQASASSQIRTVPLSQFRELLDELTRDAQPIETPAKYEGQWYRRFDGTTIGVRFSERNAVTIDTIGAIPGLRPNFKVHVK